MVLPHLNCNAEQRLRGFFKKNEGKKERMNGERESADIVAALANCISSGRRKKGLLRTNLPD